jgi:hypothetical protein
VPRSQSQNQEPQPPSQSQLHSVAAGGSLDSLGAVEDYQPYRFGWRRIRACRTRSAPVNTADYSFLRSRVQNGLLGADDAAA